MERVGLTYVRTFPTSMTAPVEGIDEREVEYEITREQWESADLTGMPGAARFGQELAGDLQ
jgi:hypothetical protein